MVLKMWVFFLPPHSAWASQLLKYVYIAEKLISDSICCNLVYNYYSSYSKVVDSQVFNSACWFLDASILMLILQNF